MKLSCLHAEGKTSRGSSAGPGSAACCNRTLAPGISIGDEIIETPMVWPCRCFETHSYRPILKDYFRRGARWTAAPRPPLTDELFDPEFRLPEKDEPISYILTEFEPVFDAADFFRCGRDLFVIRSNVTNASGVEWLAAILRMVTAFMRSRAAAKIRCTSIPLYCRLGPARFYSIPNT